ncbi:MAG: GntG family PLP-dependent aldolase [Tumebacillaceae bacterium]
MKRIEMRSDTFTLPTQEMIDAISRAELGDDVYGEDPTVKQLEQMAAECLGKEAAILLPSGTMANLTSLMAHCPRGTRVLVGHETDIYLYEAGGAAVCGGIQYEPIPNQPDGRFLLSDLEKVFPPDDEDAQFAPISLICLENPQSRCGGVVLPLSYMEEMRLFADAKGLPVHLDGARLFNAATALNVAPAEIAKYADSVQFCLSKSLAAPIGSIVAGTRTFVSQVHRLRKMLGGGMRQAGMIAAPGIVALEQVVPLLADDHRRAKRFAEGLMRIPGLVVEPLAETNMVLFRVEAEHMSWRELMSHAAERGLFLYEFGHGRLRAMTHLNISDQDVEDALSIVRELMQS